MIEEAIAVLAIYLSACSGLEGSGAVAGRRRQAAAASQLRGVVSVVSLRGSNGVHPVSRVRVELVGDHFTLACLQTRPASFGC